MGWSVGFDSNWKRDIGYGVPAICDHPGCDAEIDRGLSYVCGGEPYGGDDGCGLYFCERHMPGRCCVQCNEGKPPFLAKPDSPQWIRHKLLDRSWKQWRDENPNEVAALRAALASVTVAMQEDQ